MSVVAPSKSPIAGINAADPPPEVWFDRSSLAAPGMIIIPDVSEEDWRQHATETQICEFLDGVVYMPPPASDEHQDEVGFFSFLLRGFTNLRESGRTLCGPAVLRLRPGRNPEPDVFVIPRGPGPHSPPALIVVEVLSPGTRSHDLGLKLDLYREALIPEIIHVDSAGARLIIHTRADDLYETRIQSVGTWASGVLPGFWINVSWVFGEDRHRDLACLQRILAGPPDETAR